MKMSEHSTITAAEAKKSIRSCLDRKSPLMIWGAPGIGKSELIAEIAADMNAPVIDIRLGQLDTTDLRGIPFFNKSLGKMDWAPPVELPDEDFASQHPSVVLFLDELNGAPASVLQPAYQLLLDRKVGTYKLPDNVAIAAAGNRESDKGVTFRMPAPLCNRLTHLEMRADFNSWFDWAVTNDIHPDVIGYLSFAKQDLFDFDPKSSSWAFATPRSWTCVSGHLSDTELDDSTISNLVAGAVGEGTGLKFMAHRKYAADLPNPSDILSGKVTKMETNEISAKYSLVISMCHELRDAVSSDDTSSESFNEMFDNFMKFSMDNFETEMAIMGAKVALSVYKLPVKPVDLKHFPEFHKRYGKYIIQSQH